jgi:hypothetical protein
MYEAILSMINHTYHRTALDFHLRASIIYTIQQQNKEITPIEKGIRMPCTHDTMPPARYTELSHSDINLLTEILNHAPQSPSRIYKRSYEEIVRSQIARLPSHLLSKIPILSTFCSLHHKIISLPMVGILKAFQYEVDFAAQQLWAPLQDKGVLTPRQNDLLTSLEDLSIIWLSIEEFQVKYKRPPSVEQKSRTATKCAACALARIGGDQEAMIALGAFFIGRTSPKIWRKSKRILWMEAWLQNSMEEDSAKQAVEELWQLGKELRRLRKEYTEVKREGIEEVSKDSHQSNVLHPRIEMNSNPGWHADLTANEIFDISEDPFDGILDSQAQLEESDDCSGKVVHLPYAASSIYSQEPGDSFRGYGAGSIRYRYVESEILSLYDR